MLFTLYDGGSIARTICNHLGTSLCGCVAREFDHNFRRAAGGENGHSANEAEWRHNADGVSSIYILDVWDLFKESCLKLQDLLEKQSIAPQTQHTNIC